MNDNFYLFKRILQVNNLRRVIEPGERTPYPIIIERPTFRDTFFNMGLPEWTPFLVSIPVGTFIGYKVSFPLYEIPLVRRRCFTVTSGVIIFMAFYIGLKGSFYKLIGFEDNGLKWKRSEQRVKKYDFTHDLHGFWEDLIKGKI